MASIDRLISRLEGARQTAPDSYIARCPAHKDRSPSLSVKECPDGRILMHCFAGCPVESVVSAADMRMSDLMPPIAITYTAIRAQPIKLRPVEALAMLGHEITASVLIVDGLALAAREGDAPSPLAAERLALAAARIAKIRSFVEHDIPPEITAIRSGVAP